MINKGRTTLKSVADELGISVSVVSRVLSGQGSKYGISKATQEAVAKIAGRLRFKPNQLARGLRLAKTLTLGLVIPDISNPFFAGVAYQIETIARDAGYSIILCDSLENEDVEREVLGVLQSRMVDGLIVAPVGKTHDHLASIDQSQCPVVLVDRYFPESKIPFVTSDNFGGALQATRHLLENGHRNIAFFQGSPSAQSSMERARGFRTALAEFGIRFTKRHVLGNAFNWESGYVAAQQLLRRRPRPTAVFLANNQIALGTLVALKEKGVRVPEDISLVAFDDEPFFAHLAPPLSTVAQNVSEIGHHAIEMLQALMKGLSSLSVSGITVPTRLVLRGSVRNIGQHH